MFAFHTIDLQTHAFQQTISIDKSGLTVRQHALQAWQTLGLQMDNDAAFCGGYKTPRVFGEFVRLCPVGEPKRNGVVESLHGLWGKSFWNRRHFHSVSHVRRAGPEFQAWYEHRYHPPALNGLSPAQAQQKATGLRLAEKDIRALPCDLPITSGPHPFHPAGR